MKGRIPDEFWAQRPSFTFDSPTTNTARELSEPTTDRLHPRFPAGELVPGGNHHVSHSPRYYRSMYIPSNYEARYPYPLIVWLHAHGGSEHDLLEILPRISGQNYLGLALRGTEPARHDSATGFGWSLSDEALGAFETTVLAAVCQFRREYHIHSERIYLAGFDEGAEVGLRLMLARPEWFGGAALFGPRFHRDSRPLVRFRDLRGKRILIGAGSRDRVAPVLDTIQLSRLLHAAGMDVTTRVYNAGHETTPGMFRHLNEWLMHGIAAASCAG